MPTATCSPPPTGSPQVAPTRQAPRLPRSARSAAADLVGAVARTLPDRIAAQALPDRVKASVEGRLGLG